MSLDGKRTGRQVISQSGRSAVESRQDGNGGNGGSEVGTGGVGERKESGSASPSGTNSGKASICLRTCSENPKPNLPRWAACGARVTGSLGQEITPRPQRLPAIATFLYNPRPKKEHLCPTAEKPYSEKRTFPDSSASWLLSARDYRGIT